MGWRNASLSPSDLPTWRLLLVWDNLTGHKSAEMMVWLCQHGIMPLYTPLGGSWLNKPVVQHILARHSWKSCIACYLHAE